MSSVGTTAGRIVGRDSELAALHSFLGVETGGALVLEGGAGIGKTTLWEAGVEVARARGAQVLVARPSEAEARLALAALADLVEGVDDTVVASLPVPQHHAVEVALMRAFPAGRPPEPRAVATAFLHVLRYAAATGPVVVAIDDVQWLDAASSEALAFAARRLDDDAVSFLLTRRTGGCSDLTRALEARGLEHVELTALSLGATRRLLAERLGLEMSRRTLRTIFDAAHGNPLFALELGRVLVKRGRMYQLGEEIPVPDMVEDLLGARVSRLSGLPRKILLAVALSADLRLPQLAVLAGDPRAIADTVDAGLLVVEGERVRASHPLLLAVARRHARDEERRALHIELAGVVADDELRARHLALATHEPDLELSRLVAAAAASAASRGAAEDAVERRARASPHPGGRVDACRAVALAR